MGNDYLFIPIMGIHIHINGINIPFWEINCTLMGNNHLFIPIMYMLHSLLLGIEIANQHPAPGTTITLTYSYFTMNGYKIYYS